MPSFSFLPLFLATLLALSACANGGLFGKKVLKEPTPLKSFEAHYAFEKHWRSYAALPSGVQESLACPVQAEDNIYTLSKNGHLYAFSTDGGWRRAHLNLHANTTGGLTVEGDYIWLGTHKGELFKIDRRSFKVVQQATLPFAIYSSPLVAGGKVVVQTFNDHLFALDEDNLKILWRFVTADAPASYLGTASPSESEGFVFTGLSDGRAIAFDLDTGRQTWEARLGSASGSFQGRSVEDYHRVLNTTSRLLDMDSPPIVEQTAIYASSARGITARYDVDRSSLVPSWQVNKSTGGIIAFDDNHLYIATDHDDIYAINKRTGDVIWENHALKDRHLSSPLWVETGKESGLLVVGDGFGYLHALETNTGAIVARKRFSKTAFMRCIRAYQPSASAGRALGIATDHQGFIHAFSLKER